MAREKTFNFSGIRFDVPEVSNDATVSIQPNGQFVISKAANHKYGLDGKAIEFTWDDKKRALGLKVIMFEFEGPGWEARKMRLLKQIAGGQIMLSIGRIMKVIGLKGEGFKKLPLEHYHDQVEGRDYYYLVIPKQEGQGDSVSSEEGSEVQ